MRGRIVGFLVTIAVIAAACSPGDSGVSRTSTADRDLDRPPTTVERDDTDEASSRC
jgi:hypothetical protein